MNFFQNESLTAFHFYKAILSTSTVGMAVCDFSGQCLDVNDSMCQMIGTSREKVLAQKFTSLDSWKQSGLSDVTLAAIKERTQKHHEVTITSSFGKSLVVD